MRKFVQKVSMDVPSFEEWGKLWLAMKDLGYQCQEVSDRGFPWKAFTDDYGKDDRPCVLAYIQTDRVLESRLFYHIDHFNPDLFLAIAAMTEYPAPFVGEYGHAKSVAGLSRVASANYDDGIYSIISESGQSYGGIDVELFRKATMEELVAHFTNRIASGPLADGLNTEISDKPNEQRDPSRDLFPREQHEFQRITGINDAIIRVINRGDKIPKEWVDELNDLLSNRIERQEA
jgi:hypothetical protein